MSGESFENFDYRGFSGVFNINDLNPVKEDIPVKENISDRVVEKKDMSGGKSFLGAFNKFVAENLERQAKKTRKALNYGKYEKEEMVEELNQIKGTLREKQKDLVTMKAKYDRLMNKVVLSKEEQKSLNTLDIEIDYLQWEISELRTAQKDIAQQMNSFSYEYYEVNFIDKRLKSYLEKNPDAFKQDEQQDNRRGEQSR